MIDFIYRLDGILLSWPEGESWNLSELSTQTETSMPRVLEYLSEGLGRELDVSGTFSAEDAAEALMHLKTKMRPHIEARERQFIEMQRKAIEAFDKIQDKLRIQQVDGNWHGAFRTVTYFAGQNEQTLPHDLLINLCSEAIRLGLKSGASIQELGRWLQKGVAVALDRRNKEGIEEALDLVDAYGENFLEEPSGKGALLLGNILAFLEEPAARNELWEQYKNLVGQLYPSPIEE